MKGSSMYQGTDIEDFNRSQGCRILSMHISLQFTCVSDTIFFDTRTENLCREFILS